MARPFSSAAMGGTPHILHAVSADANVHRTRHPIWCRFTRGVKVGGPVEVKSCNHKGLRLRPSLARLPNSTRIPTGEHSRNLFRECSWAAIIACVRSPRTIPKPSLLALLLLARPRLACWPGKSCGKLHEEGADALSHDRTGAAVHPCDGNVIKVVAGDFSFASCQAGG
jgi:hypothetical protein